MTHNINEYKGEEILSDLTARLDPPNDYYPDCMCDLALTEYHLYVLEAEYGGTYTEHFILPISQILQFGTGKYQEVVNEPRGSIAPALETVIGMVLNLFITSRSGPRVRTSKSFSITYQDEQGIVRELEFKELQGSPAAITEVFEALKRKY